MKLKQCHTEPPLIRRTVLGICLVCGIPFISLADHVLVAGASWITLLLVYWGLISLFGIRFIIEGAILVFLLALLTAVLITAAFKAYP